jgi:sortase A
MRAAEMLLWSAAAVLLGVYACVYLERRVYQAFETWSFDRTLQRMPAPRAVPAALPPGVPIGRIVIPRLGMRAMIVNGTAATTLRRAVGHIEGTALLGGEGNVGLAAHRDTFFRGLRDIRKGDTIEIDTLQGAYEYVVDATRIVAPDDTAVLDASARPTLTLVTCYPFDYVGSAPRRFIVQAHRAAAPSDRGRLEALQFRR